MEMKTNPNSPVLTDAVPVSKSRLSLSSSLVPYSASSTTFPTTSGLYLTIPRRKIMPGKFDDIRASGWLDAMASSSPPRKKLNKEYDENGAAYNAWTMRYPSALTKFEQLSNYAKGKKIALFLDYDGTLSPIVDNPDRAFMSSAMRTAVRNVAKCFPTAIISGRSRDKVFEFVGLTELYYAGSHGMDIMGPIRESESGADNQNCIRSTDKRGKEVNLFQPASEFLQMIDEVFRSLVESTNEISGAKVESNKFCVSVHYRLVEEKNWSVVAQIVHDILKEYPRLKLTHGRKVLEIRPVIDWNKGKAVEFLLESLGLSNCDDMLSIYVGDDRTDEDAFKALVDVGCVRNVGRYVRYLHRLYAKHPKERVVLKEGNRGYGILVSSVPKETSASYSLRDPSEVKEFLKSLTRWKRSTSLHG